MSALCREGGELDKHYPHHHTHTRWKNIWARVSWLNQQMWGPQTPAFTYVKHTHLKLDTFKDTQSKCPDEEVTWGKHTHKHTLSHKMCTCTYMHIYIPSRHRRTNTNTQHIQTHTKAPGCRIHMHTHTRTKDHKIQMIFNCLSATKPTKSDLILYALEIKEAIILYINLMTLERTLHENGANPLCVEWKKHRLPGY